MELRNILRTSLGSNRPRSKKTEPEASDKKLEFLLKIEKLKNNF